MSGADDRWKTECEYTTGMVELTLTYNIYKYGPSRFFFSSSVKLKVDAQSHLPQQAATSLASTRRVIFESSMFGLSTAMGGGRKDPMSSRH